MFAALWLVGCWSSNPPVKMSPAPPDAPNVIVVSLDTMRSDRMSAYGYERNTTPYLASLAEKGAIFTESYSEGPMTTMSHASMFSGRHLFGHHTFKTSHRLPGEIQTLAETFQAAGYTTFARASSIRFHPSIDFDQGFDDYKAYWDLRKNARSEKVISDLHGFASQQDDAPVFAFMHLFDPHAPYNPPEPFASQFTEVREDFPPIKTVDYVRERRHAKAKYTLKDLRYLQDLYDGGLRFTDANVEEMMAGLSIPNGRSTLLVITSDHGDAFKEHGYLGHSNWLYEEIVRVPLLFVWEGHIQPGKQHSLPVGNADLYPTLVELVGLDPVEGLSGMSLAGALLGTSEASRSSGDVDAPLLLMNTRRHWAILGTVDGRRYKLVHRRKDPEELFDLTDDPGGFKSIAGDRPEIVAALRAVAEEMGVTKPLAGPIDNERSVGLDELEALKALGYVDD